MVHHESASWRREFARLVIVAGIGWLAIYTDIFGAGDAARLNSQDKYYDIRAYDLPAERSPTTAVVLATDGDLGFLETSWPLPLSVHAEIIREIAAYEPAALFVDFIYLDAREGSDDLVDALTESAERFPVFLAAPDGRGDIALPDHVRAYYRDIAASGAGVADATTLGEQGQTMQMPGAADRTPVAVAMRDAWCDRGATCAPFARRSLPREVAWRGPYLCLQDDPPAACRHAPTSGATRFARQVWHAFFPPRDAPTLAQRGLLPFPTLTIESLLADDGTEQYLDGALVYYGGSFRAASDSAASPVYGSVPGVMAHAAYAENLVVWGDRSYQVALPLQLSERSYELALVLLLALVVTVTRVSLFVYYRATGRASVPSHRLTMSSTAVTIVAGIGVAAIEAAVLRTSPEHWLIAPFVIASDGLAAWGDIKSDFIDRTVRAVELLDPRRWLGRR